MIKDIDGNGHAVACKECDGTGFKDKNGARLTLARTPCGACGGSGNVAALSQPHPADERVVEALNAVAALVELVCDETLGPSVEDEPDNESVGSNMMGPVPMTFGHVREARDAVAILRAALAQEGRKNG